MSLTIFFLKVIIASTKTNTVYTIKTIIFLVEIILKSLFNIPFIIFRQLSNGKYLQTIQILKEDDWKRTLELLKYQNGALITYTIEEDTVPGYITEINGYKIINTHEVKKPGNNYYVEVMPPKTGVEASNTNYIFIMLVMLLSLGKLAKNKLKAAFVR